jgi:hypothetical protein
MKGTIVTIDWSGKRATSEIDGPPALDQLKAAIGGGYLELVPAFSSIERDGHIVECVALCDEESKLKQMPINHVATTLWHIALKRAGYPGLLRPNGQIADVLAGPVVIVFGDQEFMEAL